MAPVSLRDPWTEVGEIVRLIRSGEAQTRPELADATRLGRNVITLRVQAAQALGLVRPSGDCKSRGGRAADVWEFSGGSGHLLIASIGDNGARVALATLTSNILELRHLGPILTPDPEELCERIAHEMDSMLQKHGSPEIWGIGIGMPAPVDFASGRNRDPVAGGVGNVRLPTNFDIRQWFAEHLGAPVWIDSVSNLTALGAAAAPDAPPDLIAVRMGRGVGSGIVSAGRLHRGADWLAGEITHIIVSSDSDRTCLCGRVGCLDAFAGGWAVELEAWRAISQGRSPQMARLEATEVTVADVVAAAEAGDVACTEIMLSAADAVGRALATLITWFNPRRLVIGGNSLASSPIFQNAMRRTFFANVLPAAVEMLEIRMGDPDRMEELHGALAMVRDEILLPSCLARWGPFGSPRALVGR